MTAVEDEYMNYYGIPPLVKAHAEVVPQYPLQLKGCRGITAACFSRLSQEIYIYIVPREPVQGSTPRHDNRTIELGTLLTKLTKENKTILYNTPKNPAGPDSRKLRGQPDRAWQNSAMEKGLNL